LFFPTYCGCCRGVAVAARYAEVEYTAAADLAEAAGDARMLAAATYFFMCDDGGCELATATN
jgi:hypothetical protein